MTDSTWEKISIYPRFNKTWNPSTSLTGGGGGYDFGLKIGFGDFDGSNIFGVGGELSTQKQTGKIFTNTDVDGAGTINDIFLINAFWGQEDEFYHALSGNRRWLSLRFASEAGFGFGKLTSTRPERDIHGKSYPEVSEDFNLFDIRKTNYLSATFFPFDARFGARLKLGFSTGISYPIDGLDDIKKKFSFNPQFIQFIIGAELGLADNSTTFKDSPELTPLDIAYYFYSSGLGVFSDALSYKATSKPVADTKDGLEQAGFETDSGTMSNPSLYDVPILYGAQRISASLDSVKRWEFHYQAPKLFKYIDLGSDGVRALVYSIEGSSGGSRDIPLIATAVSGGSDFVNKSISLLGVDKKTMPYIRYGTNFFASLIGGLILANNDKSVFGEALKSGAFTDLFAVSLSPDPGEEGLIKSTTIRFMEGWVWGDEDSMRGGVSIKKHLKDAPLYFELQAKSPLLTPGGNDKGPTDIAAIFGPELVVGSDVVSLNLFIGAEAAERFNINGNDGGVGLDGGAYLAIKPTEHFEIDLGGQGGIQKFFKKGTFSKEANLTLGFTFYSDY